MYTDIHCHLDLLEDIPARLKAAHKAGVNSIITNGVNPENNRVALSLEKKYDSVSAALGLYPHDAMALSDQQIHDEIDFIRSKKPVAIGEVGIDFHYPTESTSRMVSTFEAIISLAEQIKRPLIVHSRKAEREVIDLVASSSARVNLHCFGGSLKLVQKALDAGCYLSIPPNITRSTHFQRIVDETPLNRLLTETDSPYLSPTDAPNEPANVALSASCIAERKQILLSEATNQLWMNANKFLRK